MYRSPGLRLFEVAALALHGEDQSFQTHGKSHCRCGLSAHLFDQSVIPAAAADSPLCADVGGDKLENGLGIIIQTTNDLRVDGEVDIQRLQIFLELFEVCPAVVAQVVQNDRGILGDSGADRAFAVQDTHGVLFQTGETGLAQLVLFRFKIRPERLVVFRTTGGGSRWS